MPPGPKTFRLQSGLNTMANKSSRRTPPSRFTDDIWAKIDANARWKERSHREHYEIHVPELQKIQEHYAAKPLNAIDTAMIGDSMLWRFKGSGATTKVNRHTIKIQNDRVIAPTSGPSIFNAGVGGDKIENVLYRLGGGDEGLLAHLTPFPIKLWVVHVGTNNLRATRSLTSAELRNFELLLRALIDIKAESRILAVEVAKRTDISDEVVAASNVGLKRVVDELNEGFGKGKISLLPQPELNKDIHTADHVHLNRAGYAVWDRSLFPAIERMLR